MTAQLRQRQAGAVGASPTATVWRQLRREFAIATVAAVFLSVIGAFDTARAPIVPRTAYWLVLIWAGAGLGFVAGEAIERSPAFERRGLISAVVLNVVLTAPMTLLVWLMTAWVFHKPLAAGFLLGLAAPVFLVCAAMVALNYLADRRPRQTHAVQPSEAGPTAPRLEERLPFGLKGAEIYAVQAEDHYLRLHTSRGADLILLRLSDAVAELEGREGAQTHRSWWVAKDAVTKARTADGRAVLTLKSGVEAPVSRTYVKALRAAGWW